ncbi:uncharacterized protein LOC143213737 isoform X2 [Lasioglossum baleicum]|uniref:uncharacterized protein LOC143213737 isoform X2 n=1 Tax=Lasioglossum baleicum TaxID=434251 RepID=UPI003FCE53A7
MPTGAHASGKENVSNVQSIECSSSQSSAHITTPSSNKTLSQTISKIKAECNDTENLLDKKTMLRINKILSNKYATKKENPKPNIHNKATRNNISTASEKKSNGTSNTNQIFSTGIKRPSSNNDLGTATKKERTKNTLTPDINNPNKNPASNTIGQAEETMDTSNPTPEHRPTETASTKASPVNRIPQIIAGPSGPTAQSHPQQGPLKGQHILNLQKDPNFKEPIANVTASVGREAILTCVVQDLAGYRVAWLRVDTQTILTISTHIITKNHRISVSHSDHRTWFLHIREVRESDRGWYMCQINTDPMKSQTGYLEVVVPPDILDYQTSTDMVVQEGSNVTLRCAATGSPEPTITWRREDGQLILLPSGDEVATIGGSSFNITKVNRLHMGSYLCIASNHVPPSVSKRIMLIVHFPPMISIPNQLVGAREGQELTLDCLSEAYPKSINYWTRDKDEIVPQGITSNTNSSNSNTRYKGKLRHNSGNDIFEGNQDMLKERDLKLRGSKETNGDNVDDYEDSGVMTKDNPIILILVLVSFTIYLHHQPQLRTFFSV